VGNENWTKCGKTHIQNPQSKTHLPNPHPKPTILNQHTKTHIPNWPKCGKTHIQNPQSKTHLPNPHPKPTILNPHTKTHIPNWPKCGPNLAKPDWPTLKGGKLSKNGQTKRRKPSKRARECRGPPQSDRWPSRFRETCVRY
jgi:hypothetical protein